MAVHPFHANGFRFSQIRETPTKTPTVPISGAYGLREAEWLVRGSERKGVWGLVGPCHFVKRSQKFLLEIGALPEHNAALIWKHASSWH